MNVRYCGRTHGPCPARSRLYYLFTPSFIPGGARGKRRRGTRPPQLGLCPPFSSGLDSACPEDQATPGKVFTPGILLE